MAPTSPPYRIQTPLLLVLALVLWATNVPAQDFLLPIFVDTTEQSGIQFFHSFGDEDMSNIIESAGSGCAFLDYDNDGWLDLYVVNIAYLPYVNDEPYDERHTNAVNRLFHNNGDGTFTDVTEQSGSGDPGFGMAAVVGDIDNDGFKDIYVTNYGRNTLFINNGDGTFVDITLSAGVADTLSGVGAAFLDFDHDGYLDIYSGNYLEYDPEYHLYYAADFFPGPLAYIGQPDRLYRNNGDRTFTDVTETAGVVNDGRAMGVSTGDFDNDGWADIYVANDAQENYLYRNNQDGTFTNVAFEAGVAYSANGETSSSMGADFGDYDNDGDLDVVVPDLSYNNLYMNTGDGLFYDVTSVTGLARASGQFINWSGDFGDFNNDGNLDLLISSGDAHRLDTMETVLLMNTLNERGERVFRDMTDECGEWFRKKSVSRGMAVGDYDNDGDLDFFLLNLDKPSQLIRNDGGNQNNWLLVDLTGTQSNRDGIGARVIVRAAEFEHLEEVRSASGYLSQNDTRLHFGLGAIEIIDEIEIRWPSGIIQKLTEVAVDQILEVTEPAP